MTDRRRFFATLGLAGLVLLLGAGRAAADYRASYTKGIRGVDKSDWSEAAQSMRDAINENPSESAKKVKLYGTRFVPYVPHYHLGVALYHLGDCAGALTAWAESERQGVIQGLNEYRTLESLREECRAQVPTPTPRRAAPPTPTPTPLPPELDPRRLREAETAAERAIALAEQAQSEISQRSEDAGYAAAWRANPQLGNRRDEAVRALVRARDMLRSGRSAKDLARLEDAARLATQSRQSLDSTVAAVDTLREELAQADRRRQQAAVRRAREELQTLVTGARQALADGSALSAAGQRTVGDRQRAVEQLIGQAEGLSDNASAAQLSNARDALDGAVAAYREAVGRRLAIENKPIPPTPTPLPTATPMPAGPDSLPVLRSGVRAFLDGDFAGAVSLLHAEGIAEARQAAVAHLVRAAAQYYLYLEGGEEDGQLRDRAAADVRSCHAEDPDVRPLAELFSPRFISFFDRGL